LMTFCMSANRLVLVVRRHVDLMRIAGMTCCSAR